jgi:polar amino acid transport system substrate-binding protein
MKRLLAVLISLIFAAHLVAADGDMVLLTSADNPPYEFTRGGEVVGFDVDLAKIIAEKIGKRLVVRDMPFSSLIPALMAKQGDFAMAAISPTDARRENVDFSVPYQRNVSAVVVVNTAEFAYMADKGATFPIALFGGKTVGVQLGTHHETDIRTANIPGISIRRYDGVNTMVAEMLKSAGGAGTVDAIVVGTPEAKEIVKKNPRLCHFQLKFADSFAIAFPKGSPHRDAVNKIIELLLENGKISDLEIKWDIGR